MVFGGIQKLTLLDYPEKTACTVFTVGCNFRCLFCQNSSLIDPSGSIERIDESDILSYLETRRGLLDGVCISGGEPLMQDDLDVLIDKIREMGFLVKLDTNGSYPDKLEKLLFTGRLDYVAMDIKNSQEKYSSTIGIHGYDISPIKKSINLLQTSTIPYEFRTTVVSGLHTGEDLLSIAQWISGARKYYLQVFTDSDGVVQSGLLSYSDTEMRQFLSDIKEIQPNTELRGI